MKCFVFFIVSLVPTNVGIYFNKLAFSFIFLLNISLIYLFLSVIFERLKFKKASFICKYFFEELVLFASFFFLKFIYIKEYIKITKYQFFLLKRLLTKEPDLSFFDKIILFFKSFYLVDFLGNFLIFFVVFYKPLPIYFFILTCIWSSIYYSFNEKYFARKLKNSYNFSIYKMFFDRIDK